MKKQLSELNTKLNGLAVFRKLLDTQAVKCFQRMVTALEDKDLNGQVSAYGAFAEALYESDANFSKYINDFLLSDENFYIKQKAQNKEVSPLVEVCLLEELKILEELSQVTSEAVKSVIAYKGSLPHWENTVIDYRYDYQERIHALPYTGYGMYASFTVFHLEERQLSPVKYPDNQSLDQLFGYERERQLIMKNTEALVSGKGASNMLLYGDAGTGKSSTVKAVANYFAPKGLRLVEIKKNQLFQIPYLVETLSANPLKFVLFIDDLSFTSNDDNFSALKAILEGGVSACGDNIAIYATSNRRHLVKETMGDRMGDELHVSDTLQETMSLASRFGLVITYLRPEKEAYLSIVKSLADEYGLVIEEKDLFKKAEAHAIRCHGRSPRVAKQFVELQMIGI